MTQSLPLSQLRDLFHCGKYNDVLSALGRAPRTRLYGDSAETWALQIGALVFTGEVSQAQVFFESAVDDFPPVFQAQARFFIGVGLIRLSRYEEARAAFQTNLLLLRTSKKPSAELKFYCWQGSAFFRFFAGRLTQAQTRAQKAYLAALETGLVYGQILSLDLLGHCHCLTGEVRRGLADLERALTLCQELGNGGTETALKVSIVKYRAQFGLDLKGAEAKLRTASRKLAPQDTYSRGELFLELSRQLVLRGKASEAQELLDQNCDSIYRHQNRRQSATYHLRYAYILHLKGESHAALTLLRSARANLVVGLDPLHHAQLAGLEQKVLESLGRPSMQERPVAAVTSIDLRIRAREAGGALLSVQLGQDPLGDWLDRVRSATRSKQPDSDELAALLVDLVRVGLLGLLPAIFGPDSAQSAIVLGPRRGEMLAYSRGDVRVAERGLTSSMKRLLLALQGGSQKRKEDLVQEVWGYVYRPDLHDGLLHATVGKLRKLLDSFGGWIEWSEGSYRLNPSVQVRETARTAQTPSATLPMAPATYVAPPTKHNLFNYRQLQALRTLQKGEFLGVAEYARRFRVSKMTACRDLTSLAASHKVTRVGRARATRYELA